MEQSTTARRVLERMDAQGIDQSELARMVGATPAAINQIVKGKTRNSRLLPKIAVKLRTTVDHLTGETDDPDDTCPGLGLTSEERDWIELLRALAPSDRAAALQLVRTIATSAQSPRLQAHKRDWRGAESGG